MQAVGPRNRGPRESKISKGSGFHVKPNHRTAQTVANSMEETSLSHNLAPTITESRGARGATASMGGYLGVGRVVARRKRVARLGGGSQECDRAPTFFMAAILDCRLPTMASFCFSSWSAVAASAALLPFRFILEANDTKLHRKIR